MKHFVLAGLVTLAATAGAFANEKGNGGSGEEVSTVIVQQNINGIIRKIAIFFEKNPLAQKDFPEVNFEAFFKIAASVKLEVSEETLIDKNDIVRTCLNFSESSIIRCNKEKFAAINADIPSQFVLVFHELLGLLGVEESSPERELISSYKISQRLKKYVTKVSSYDLVYEREEAPTSTMEYYSYGNKFGTGLDCRVKLLFALGNEMKFSGIIKGLEKKGYVFSEDVKNDGTNKLSYLDHDLENGFVIKLGIQAMHMQDSRTVYYSKFFSVYQEVRLANGRIHQIALKQDMKNRIPYTGKYNEDKVVEWAMKNIPNCDN